MRKTIYIILLVCIVCFCGCNKPAQTTDAALEKKNATLMIGGKEPTEEYYAYMDDENQEIFVSLLTLIRGLGGKIDYSTPNRATIDLHGHTYQLNYNKKTFVDGENGIDWLMIPPGGQAVSGFPKFIDKDVILDTTRIVSFLSSCDMLVSTDYENKVIYVEYNQAKKDEMAGDTTTTDTTLYAAVIDEYNTIVSRRLQEDFEEHWNSGERIDIPSAVATPKESSFIVGHWSNMLVEMTNGLSSPCKESFDYALCDINDDGVPELFWLRDNHTLLAMFTYTNDQVVLLDAFWSRYKGVITETGMLYTRSSGGAVYTDYVIRSLTDDGQWKEYASFGVDGYNEENSAPYYYETVENTRTAIDRERFDALREQWPFAHSERWFRR